MLNLDALVSYYQFQTSTYSLVPNTTKTDFLPSIKRYWLRYQLELLVDMLVEQRITATVNNVEQRRLLMDLDISMRSSGTYLVLPTNLIPGCRIRSWSYLSRYRSLDRYILIQDSWFFAAYAHHVSSNLVIRSRGHASCALLVRNTVQRSQSLGRYKFSGIEPE